MRILIFNWKDVRHHLAGGAERVTHELAKQLVNRGHEVIIFTSMYPRLKTIETFDGVTVIRRGNLFTVHIHACLYFLTHLKDWPDIVIDQIHGIPFFTPLFTKKPILAWIHEVAGAIWFKEFPLPLALFGLLIESIYFKLYKRTIFMTHTSSTQYELIHKSIPKHNIYVLPHTLSNLNIKLKPKAKRPTLIYVGRLVPMKQVELLLKGTCMLKTVFPKLSVLIVGEGKSRYSTQLLKLRSSLHLEKTVQFLGYASEEKKFTLLSRAWLHVQPSLKEGFGLTVLEAARCKTPTICFANPGISRVVVNGKNGVMIPVQSVTALAQTIHDLLQNNKRRAQLSRAAYSWSMHLPSWQTQAKKFEQLMMTALKAPD